MRSYGPARRQPLPDFIKSRAVQRVAQLAEQVVREGHAFEGRTRLKLAMQIGGYIPDLNHNWHAISMLTCRTHVNGLASRFINFYRFGVTRVRSNTLAVAARNASAGSRRDRRVFVLASAISVVRGAGVIRLSTHILSTLRQS
jgi:hypothetical protein